MESMIDQVARTLKVDVDTIKKMNLYKDRQVWWPASGRRERGGGEKGRGGGPGPGVITCHCANSVFFQVTPIGVTLKDCHLDTMWDGVL